MTNDALLLTNKILSLETELMVLRAELSRLLQREPAKRTTDFASLEGIWKGQGNLSLDEIRSAEIQVSDLLI